MENSTRRKFVQGVGALALVPQLPRLVGAAQSKLGWSATRSGANDFFRAPVLLNGEKEALLIDGSFNYPAGKQLVEAIKASGKQLTRIFISCADPDYYFSLKPVKEAFPDVKVLAATATIEAIKANVQKKIDTWGPKLGANGPQNLNEIVFAQAYDMPTLDLEGNRIEIVTSKLMRDRRYLWVPSLNAAFGGVYGFDGLHVWTADTQTPSHRAAWIRELELLIERKPEIVVASHAAAGANNGVQSLEFTRDYLVSYEKEVAKAKNSSALIAAMDSQYPNLGLRPALEIGAKVAKGEMRWG